MRDPTLALVPIHDATCCLPHARQKHPRTTLGGAALVAIAAVAVTAPTSAFLLVGSIIVGLTALGWYARLPEGASAINPAEIESSELAASYRALLASHAELARVVAAEDTTSSATASLLDRSRDTVVMCGKLALIASRGERYAALHPAEVATTDAEILRMRASAATDPETAALLANAATSAERRSALVTSLRRSRERTCAQLEAVRGALDTLIATLVNRNLTNDRDLVLAADSVAARLDELDADVTSQAA